MKGQAIEKRRVGGELVGYELGEQADELGLEGVALGEEPETAEPAWAVFGTLA